MTKTEIRDNLKRRGLFDKTGNKDLVWVEAFNLHYKETRVRLSMNCGGCWNRVRNWLNS